MAALPKPRIAAFRPGLSPPAVRIPTRIVLATRGGYSCGSRASRSPGMNAGQGESARRSRGRHRGPRRTLDRHLCPEGRLPGVGRLRGSWRDHGGNCGAPRWDAPAPSAPRPRASGLRAERQPVGRSTSATAPQWAHAPPRARARRPAHVPPGSRVPPRARVRRRGDDQARRVQPAEPRRRSCHGRIARAQADGLRADRDVGREARDLLGLHAAPEHASRCRAGASPRRRRQATRRCRRSRPDRCGPILWM